MTEELNPNPTGRTATETEATNPETPAVEAEKVETKVEPVAEPAKAEAVTAPTEEKKSAEAPPVEAPSRGREGGSYSGDRQRGYYDRDGGQSFDQMMKAFRKQSVDIQRKLKKSRFYEKPSVKRRKQRQEAIKKARKNRRFH